MSQIYSKDSLDRFGDDLCEILLSYLSLEDRFRYECLSTQWQRSVFTTQIQLIIIVKNKSFEKNLKLCKNVTQIVYSSHMVRHNRTFGRLFSRQNELLFRKLRDISFITTPEVMKGFKRFVDNYGKSLHSIHVEIDGMYSENSFNKLITVFMAHNVCDGNQLEIGFYPMISTSDCGIGRHFTRPDDQCFRWHKVIDISAPIVNNRLAEPGLNECMHCVNSSDSHQIYDTFTQNVSKDGRNDRKKCRHKCGPKLRERLFRQIW
ncbi:unnamed protein product [Oppiella nova]|uniref:F-box domain-containing protein n=1 Tax=Oppiella nova TaxID=334625 RepID=A0A7R9QQX8_9ACAR|nr:unnamed protein product [Oppiella nova]CAG2171801.1 unnamed protein product [Oppiella nova]